MKCKSARRLVSQYIDDELGSDEKAAFLLHIEGCPACKERLEEIRAVNLKFASAERFDAPHGFATRVLANIQEGASPALSGFRRFLLRGAEVVFAVAIMSIGVISGNQMVAHRTPPTAQATLQETFSLDLFQPNPPGSIGALYLSMMEAGDER
ncbi:MAG: anti-sigma factor [Thermodesulfobacteriota bacterium]